MPDDEKFVPRPPPARTTTDFIVIVFVMLVAGVLIVLTIGAVVAVFVAGVDPKAFFTVLLDLMTSIISALVGYMAGRGTASREDK